MFGPRAHIRITADFSPPRYEPNLATPPHIPPSAIGADSTRPRHPFNFPHSFWLRSQLGGPTAGVRSCLRVRARRRSRSPFWAIVLSRFRLNSPECARDPRDPRVWFPVAADAAGAVPRIELHLLVTRCEPVNMQGKFREASKATSIRARCCAKHSSRGILYGLLIITTRKEHIFWDSGSLLGSHIDPLSTSLLHRQMHAPSARRKVYGIRTSEPANPRRAPSSPDPCPLWPVLPADPALTSMPAPTYLLNELLASSSEPFAARAGPPQRLRSSSGPQCPFLFLPSISALFQGQNGRGGRVSTRTRPSPPAATAPEGLIFVLPHVPWTPALEAPGRLDTWGPRMGLKALRAAALAMQARTDLRCASAPVVLATVGLGHRHLHRPALGSLF